MPLKDQTQAAHFRFHFSVSAVRLNNGFTLAALCEPDPWFGFDVRSNETSAAVLYYDYALTITSEIQYYWSPPSFSLSFALYVVNRYIGLIGPIPLFLEYLFELSEHVSFLPI